MGKKTQLTTTSIILLLFIGISVIGETEEVELPACSDGIDNDGDGLTDGQDENCFFVMSSTGTPNPIYCENWNDETISPQTLNDCA